VFLVNGKPPARGALWLLVRGGNGDVHSVVSKPGAIASARGSSDEVTLIHGWTATFTGCRAHGS
jgi:hypothetical protein